MKTGTNEFAQYQREVDNQCRFVIRAGAALEAAAALPDRPLAADLATYHGQTLLTAAGIASLLLWGRKDKGAWPDADALKPLRDSLEITEASPLKPREIRDSYAHINERISAAMAAGPTVVTMRLGKRPTDPEHASRPILRHYDPSTGTLGFGPHVVQVPALVSEARRIDAVFATLQPFEVALREGRIEEWLAAEQQRTAMPE